MHECVNFDHSIADWAYTRRASTKRIYIPGALSRSLPPTFASETCIRRKETPEGLQVLRCCCCGDCRCSSSLLIMPNRRTLVHAYGRRLSPNGRFATFCQRFGPQFSRRTGIRVGLLGLYRSVPGAQLLLKSHEKTRTKIL